MIDQQNIFAAMGDESWLVRKEAVEIYVQSTPDHDSVQLLLELIRNEDNAGLRNSAAEAAIRLGSLTAPLLIKMMDDGDAALRKFIIDIMGGIGDSLFVPSLIRALNDPEANVASAAAERLGVLGDTDAAEHLMKALFLRDDLFFHFAVLGALRVLAKPIPIPGELLQLADNEILRKAVFDCVAAIKSAHLLSLNPDCK